MSDDYPHEDERALKKRAARKSEHADATKKQAAKIRAELNALRAQARREEEDAKNNFVNVNTPTPIP